MQTGAAPTCSRRCAALCRAFCLAYVRHGSACRDRAGRLALRQAGKLAFDFSEGLVVGLRLPEGAEREVLRAKWADFSGNISSYVVRAAAAHGSRCNLGC